MKVNWQSQEVLISNNYAAVARNCLGSGRPSVLRSGHVPQDHVNLVGCSFMLMGDYSRVHSKALISLKVKTADPSPNNRNRSVKQQTRKNLSSTFAYRGPS